MIVDEDPDPAKLVQQLRHWKGRVTQAERQSQATHEHWKRECDKRDAVIAELRRIIATCLEKAEGK